jgi:hypothetical protein
VTRIVRTAYRYKRPPRKRKPVALEVPAIVTISDKTRRRRSDTPSEGYGGASKVRASQRRPQTGDQGGIR